jgi:hypothetical protein
VPVSRSIYTVRHILLVNLCCAAWICRTYNKNRIDPTLVCCDVRHLHLANMSDCVNTPLWLSISAEKVSEIFNPGSNPTALSCSAPSSLARFEIKNVLF